MSASIQQLPEPRVELHRNLSLTVHSQTYADEYNDGNRYVVLVDGATAHRSFRRASELASWAGELNLKLPATEAELQEGSGQPIRGQYHEVVHANTETFEAVDGIRTRTWCEGEITAAQTVTDLASGQVAMHAVGACCETREVFDGMLWPLPGEQVGVYARPDDRSIYDVIGGWTHEDGAILQISGTPLSVLRERFPEAKLYTLSEAVDRIERACITPVREISEAVFDDARDALPPEGWVRSNQAESFKFAERYSGLITTIYARVEDRYFMFHDRCTMRHARIMERVEASGLLKQPKPQFEDEQSEAPRMG
ncbi:hypothetical protein [Pseudoxanthomonas kaohsiungensis]|uniref:DUF932 domain-containing protein n=1 Tax=Pseudoxanthomonas kaohsiungensis TaxID=283923 RepID=A0ABW3M0N8_9GAMM|nr:hypothetical protein [Pseudoxanthomonas kaohsiungensis]KAF1702909.1 hypothetical protein CSC66_09040 [Pseudoxanthomonas kaohsiungensis]